jgi:1,4-dihydroxy-6-naphthoate synthase
MQPLKIAFSPCPNDTFIFHHWVHGLIKDAPQLEVTYADIDYTNRWASEGTTDLDVMKISAAALPYVLDKYQLIPCGGALGRGCGPLVLAKDAGIDLTEKTIAVPSDRSTAYLLFRMWANQNHVRYKEIRVMPFEKIMPAVKAGEVDAGLVIHEARFTYSQFGLNQVVDLGEWWEMDTGLPIPLGAIVAKRTCDAALITRAIQASLQAAWENPDDTKEYVSCHAQEMNDSVMQAHIALYVNEFSMNLGEEGFNAISAFLQRATTAGLLPAFDESLVKNREG